MFQLNNYQTWISEFYKERGWYHLDPFIRTNFLSEEIGEIARAVRTIEIGRNRPDLKEDDQEKNLQNLSEEIGDVLGNLCILAEKYNFDLESILNDHKQKLIERFDS